MSSTYKNLTRLLLLATVILVSIWFLHLVLDIILLVFFAVVLTIVLNAPVAWLESKGMGRTIASLLVFFGMILLLGLVGWMIMPKIISQVKLLINNLPDYMDMFNRRVTEWISDKSANGETPEKTVSPFAQDVSTIINRIGQYSISVLNTLLSIIFFFCLVAYMLINPRPLLEMYLSCFSAENRAKAAKAFAYASKMTIGWMWANIFAGAIRAVIVWVFLYYMDIPGVWVWAGVTFFAELIPKIGFYIMSVPPILIAFSISPSTAMWVAIFFLALDELIADVLMPRLRSSTMKIHPVSILVMLMAMSAAFGVIGAFIATPLTAFVKAYYEIFFQKEIQPEELKTEVDDMLYLKSTTQK